eukprot:SAG22_NODE_175_length_16235_cov_67.112729_13_plen_68_part_00
MRQGKTTETDNRDRQPGKQIERRPGSTEVPSEWVHMLVGNMVGRGAAEGGRTERKGGGMAGGDGNER